MTDQTEQQQAFTELMSVFKVLAETEQRQFNERQNREITSFLGSLPEDAKAVYLHMSHRIERNHPFVSKIQEKYGLENVLITVAPSESGQSFYNNSRDEIAHQQKTAQVITPYEEFSKNRPVDAFIYLCNYVCDGYQSPIFPEDVVTSWHIWRPIKLAEQNQKPLIVGYRDNFCFSNKCYEREYITDPEQVKCPIKTLKIW